MESEDVTVVVVVASETDWVTGVEVLVRQFVQPQLEDINSVSAPVPSATDSCSKLERRRWQSDLLANLSLGGSLGCLSAPD